MSQKTVTRSLNISLMSVKQLRSIKHPLRCSDGDAVVKMIGNVSCKLLLTSFRGDGDVVVEELTKLHVHVRCELDGITVVIIMKILTITMIKMTLVTMMMMMTFTVVERGPTLSLALAFAA